jgi:hypothetical protein
MSPETERVPVPTNGKGPHAIEEPPAEAEAPHPDQPTAAFTPTQLAVGFGIVASLILLGARRMRRRGRSGRGLFGRR